MGIQALNPATEEIIKDYPEMTSEEVSSIITKAHQAFEQWRTTKFSDRAGLMKKAGAILRNNKEEYAQLMTAEMGKPVAQARGEVEKCAWVCDYYAENAEKFLAPEDIATDASRSFISYQPLGIVLAVMPWN